MKQILKKDLLSFMKYYEDFHDGYIININYDISSAKIEMLMNVYTNGNKVLIKMVFNGIEKYRNKEVFSWDFIYKAVLKTIKIDNKEFLLFATSKDKPLVYIVCNDIEYEEINNDNTK